MMLKFFSLLSLLGLSSYLVGQQSPGIQTENDLGVGDLVRSVFIKGSCRNVSNITSIGNDTLSIGQFSAGGNSIALNQGIILSTGDIALAEGPNRDNETTFAFGALGSDPDLDQLATSDLYDLTGIEFDFVPLADRVTFRYVFASEEYCEFVGTSFNDVFGFFVSGPGINGPFSNNAINVATLQGTDVVVSINTINHLDNSTSFINNGVNVNSTGDCGIIESAQFPELIEYDGFTVPLTATIDVIPCETYHIRLLITDVGDDRLDSAVFLESNSFDLGEPINVIAEVPGSDMPIAFENCVDGRFVFERRDNNNISQDQVVEYNISQTSSAINGVDFSAIPMSITIPAGESSIALPISIIEDNIVEGPENIQLELIYDCDCIDPEFSELIINEASELSISFENIEVCIDQAFSISPEIRGGVMPYEFLWSNGVNMATLQESVNSDTDYTVTVTDFCRTTSSANVDIDIQSQPSASLSGNFTLCEVAATGIPATLEGNPPWRLEYSIDGNQQEVVENIISTPFFINTPTEGTYELTAFSDAFCDGIVQGFAEVESPFIVEAEIISPSCFNSTDGSIEITQLEAAAPFTLEWSIDTEDELFLDSLSTDTIRLRIIDSNDCVFEEVFELGPESTDFIECASIYIPNIFSPNNDGINDVFSIFFSDDSGIVNIISFQVYNQWGELMYNQANFLPRDGDIGWRGDFKESSIQSDVYVYKINIAFEDGSTHIISGEVTILL